MGVQQRGLQLPGLQLVGMLRSGETREKCAITLLSTHTLAGPTAQHSTSGAHITSSSRHQVAHRGIPRSPRVSVSFMRPSAR